MSQPGDVFWVEQHDFVSWAIRFAQRVKYHGNPCAAWNHCGLVVGFNGEISEADPTGMALGNLTEYGGVQMAIRRPPYQQPWEDSGQLMPGGATMAVTASQELVEKHEKYGFLSILSVSLALLTGTKLRLGVSGHQICSGAVSYALTRANIDMGDDEEWNTPADVMAIADAQKWMTVQAS